jgi:hypothetical protein
MSQKIAEKTGISGKTKVPPSQFFEMLDEGGLPLEKTLWVGCRCAYIACLQNNERKHKRTLLKPLVLPKLLSGTVTRRLRSSLI